MITELYYLFYDGFILVVTGVGGTGPDRWCAMSQSSSKHPANGAARGQSHTLGRAAQAKPAINVRSRTSPESSRHLAQLQLDPGDPEGPADQSSAPCPPGYLQWAGFVAGTQDGIFGFGAYFVDDESGARITGSTWTPSGRR
jgi:hypothetical protein